MSKHTPGPWGVSYSTRSLVFRQGSNEQIAGCYGTEAHANARLIAAAPTMYEYIEERAAAGDERAAKILEAIHASR